jgi:hypothetical protein
MTTRITASAISISALAFAVVFFALPRDGRT